MTSTPKRTSTHRSPARFAARMLPGARPGPYPGFIAPCNPTLKSVVPIGERWLYEIKHDGYRVQAHLKAGEPALLTSSGLNWSGRFRSIATSLADLPANDIIIDGEVVVPDDSGVADFSLLQADLSKGRSDRMRYYAFDLLFLDGFDIRAAPLIDRRRVLSELLGPKPVGRVLFSKHTEGDGTTLFERACAMGLEGLICKVKDGPYRSGKSESWLKVKCVRQGVFAVVGFVPDRDSIASLHLARWEAKTLTYVGKVGTGFSRRVAYEIRQLLQPLATTKPVVKPPVREPTTTWVRPELAVNVEYRTITSDGLLRHASYKGLTRTKKTSP